MQAAGAEPCLGDHECGALIADAIALRDADVLEQDLAMAAGIVEAEYLELADDGHTGRVHRHQHHGVARMPLGLGMGHADEQDHLGVGMRGAAREPLMAIDDVIIAVAIDARGELRGIGAGDLRLGHADAGPDLAASSGCEPRLLLLGRAELREHLHVAGVRRGAVHRLGRDASSSP